MIFQMQSPHVLELPAVCQLAHHGIFGAFDIELEKIDVRSNELRQASRRHDNTRPVVTLPQGAHFQA
jgi:hypothetical protein